MKPRKALSTIDMNIRPPRTHNLQVKKLQELSYDEEDEKETGKDKKLEVRAEEPPSKIRKVEHEIKCECFFAYLYLHIM